MGKVVIPKHCGELNEIYAALKIYFDANDWVENDIYNEALKSEIGENQYQSSYPKKRQVPAYFGFLEADSSNSRKWRITERGKRFYRHAIEGNSDAIIDDLISSMEETTFGRNNDGCPSSDSDVEPPTVFIKAILDLGYLTLVEYAYLIWSLADEGANYNVVIDELKRFRKDNSLVLPEEAEKYKDPKPITALSRWGILHSEILGRNTKKYTIEKDVLSRYNNRLKSFRIYNTGFDIPIGGEHIDLLSEEQPEDRALVEELKSDDFSNVYSGFEYRGIPKTKSAPEITGQRRVYKRSKTVAQNALSHAGFKCEIDPNHLTFARKTSGIPYTEPHHLIPMEFSDDFDCSLDVEENVVSLCSHCHNLIHYGKDADKLIKALYYNRKDNLANVGLDITEEQLIEYYK